MAIIEIHKGAVTTTVIDTYQNLLEIAERRIERGDFDQIELRGETGSHTWCSKQEAARQAACRRAEQELFDSLDIDKKSAPFSTLDNSPEAYYAALLEWQASERSLARLLASEEQPERRD